ncbi:MAG: EAL domain-containing protein [Deltaproteobacteria bacterium]|nr:EAL domain-containing protein [Deltaproteobacteria bacterium]
MSLNGKALLIHLSFLFLMLLTLLVIGRVFVLGEFGRLERQEITRDLERVEMAIDSDLAPLATLARDWGFKDDTYRFVQDRNREFQKANLNRDSLRNIGLHFLLLTDRQGTPVWGGYLPGNQALAPAPAAVTDFIKERLKRDYSQETGFKGLFQLERGQYCLVAATRILRSDRSGPEQGWVAMGRLFDKAYLDRVAGRTKLELSFDPAGPESSAPLPAPFRQDEKRIFLTKTLFDRDGIEVGRLTVTKPRAIFRAGVETAVSSLLIYALFGILFMGLTIYFLKNQVLDRVSRLSREVEQRGEEVGDFTPIPCLGNDELTRLAEKFNDAFLNLRETRQYLEQVQNLSPMGLMLVDAESRKILYVNDYASSLVGLPPQDIVGNICHQFVCPSAHYHCQFLDLGRDCHCSRRILLGHEGKKIPIIKSVGRFVHKGCEVLMETFMDYSEADAAQQETQKSEERFRAIFMNTGTASLIVDETEAIQLANREFLELAGHRQDEGYFTFWTDYFDSQEIAAIRHNLVREEEDPDPRNVTGEFTLMGADGRHHFVELKISKLPYSDHSIISFLDVTGRKQAEMSLEKQAFFDPLTGLPNRSYWYTCLDEALKKGAEGSIPLAVMLIDLDDFKKVNDSLGHQTGDQLLKEVAGRVSEVIRRHDVFCRLGGDEFTILIQDLKNSEDLDTIAGKILATMKRPFQLASTEIYIGCSIGISLFPADGKSRELLFSHADLAMYDAKQKGKNNYSFYLSGMDCQISERLSLEKEIRNALELKQFEPHFQPIYALGDHSLYGVEALARWRKGQGEIVLPKDFIPFAESTGLIIPIDLHIMESACRTVAAWNGRYSPALTLSVNVSAQHFQRGNLIGDIENILHRTGLPHSCLNIEITETTLMENFPNARKVIEKLNAKGISFSLDDFGTGHSSLFYLSELPFQTLKIAKTFIDMLAENRNGSESMVSTVIAMARQLEMTCTAEGVEENRDLEFLQQKGCDSVQGFIFSPALEARDFEERILPFPFNLPADSH